MWQLAPGREKRAIFQGKFDLGVAVSRGASSGVIRGITIALEEPRL